METLFTKIIRGEVPAYKIMEDDQHLAFLDIRPIKKGHTLVIPKKESDYVFGLSDAELSSLMIFAKKVAKVLQRAVSCRRIGVMVAGLEVPHTHIHLIPMDHVRDLAFANAHSASPEELQQTASEIQAKI